MPTRGHLGHDPAVTRVQVGLGGDDVGEDVPSSVTSAAGLVTRRFEAEDQALAGSRTGSLHMISASSRLSV